MPGVLAKVVGSVRCQVNKSSSQAEKLQICVFVLFASGPGGKHRAVVLRLVHTSGASQAEGAWQPRALQPLEGQHLLSRCLHCSVTLQIVKPGRENQISSVLSCRLVCCIFPEQCIS